MKLTSEEEEIIALPDEGCNEEIESCALSLIGKLLTCKPFNKKAAQDTLRRASSGCLRVAHGLLITRFYCYASGNWV